MNSSFEKGSCKERKKNNTIFCAFYPPLLSQCLPSALTSMSCLTARDGTVFYLYSILHSKFRIKKRLISTKNAYLASIKLFLQPNKRFFNSKFASVVWWLKGLPVEFAAKMEKSFRKNFAFFAKLFAFFRISFARKNFSEISLLSVSQKTKFSRKKEYENLANKCEKFQKFLLKNSTNI